MDIASFDSSARQYDGLAFWPVPPAFIPIDPRGAPKLAHPDDQGVVQHSPLVQVVEESRRGFVHPRVNFTPHLTNSLDSAAHSSGVRSADLILRRYLTTKRFFSPFLTEVLK